MGGVEESHAIRLGNSHHFYIIVGIHAIYTLHLNLTPNIGWKLHNVCYSVMHLDFDLEAERLRKCNKTQVIKQDVSVCHFTFTALTVV